MNTAVFYTWEIKLCKFELKFYLNYFEEKMYFLAKIIVNLNYNLAIYFFTH